jgi:hypothetical protein
MKQCCVEGFTGSVSFTFVSGHVGNRINISYSQLLIPKDINGREDKDSVTSDCG